MRILLATAVILLTSACSTTTQHVTLGKSFSTKQIVTVAQVVAADNSGQMDGNLEVALANEGLTLRGKLPAGSATAKGVDALVSYSDTWNWDMVMFMKNLTVRFINAESGELIALGQWNESRPHPFRGDKGVTKVVQELITEMVAKIRTQSKSAQ